MNEICELIWYKEGRLPFKYLGVPISPKTPSSMDCKVLVEKMPSKIKTWGSRNMSYAGRAQLINSVLMQLYVYWASIFILPRKIMKIITGICKNYFWDGKVHNNRVPLIAWKTICKGKKGRGLGIND